eukprot:maker-scaffold487_size158652-snap-gene-0.40 protein:Tk00172 transcript:maker-scaffold487_size158652-snap-gene-0.40-mRNA-1 annotation:"gamma-aminobutyric acid receptor subunit delta-like"
MKLRLPRTSLFLGIFLHILASNAPLVSSAKSSFTCPFTVLPNNTLKYDEPNPGRGTLDYEEDGIMKDPLGIIWCLPKTYTMERPPFLDKQISDQRLELKFNFDIREISEINDRYQTVSIPMYFSIAWPEQRLWINETHPAWQESMTGPRQTMTEDPKILLRELWMPDMEIYGLENFGSKSVLKEMSGLRIKRDKIVEYNIKVTVTFSCRMVFDDYPFDSHTCTFLVGSYYYTKDVVTCKSTFDNPLENDPSRQRNLQHHIEFSNLTNEYKVIELSSGEYMACGFQIHMRRKRYQLIFQIYLPCILFVCVSWVSFLIRPLVVPGRMALLVTLFLVLVNIFNNVRSSAPIPASISLNAIDTYLVVSIFMVFLALLEYAVVLFTINIEDSQEIHRKKDRLKEALAHTLVVDSPMLNSGSRTNTPSGASRGMKEVIDEINASLVLTSPDKVLLNQDSYKLGNLSLRKFDMIALVVLPIAFMLFNLGYWVHYTLIQ